MENEPRKPDYDLSYVFEILHNNRKLKDVVDILACVPGEADGFAWHWIIKFGIQEYAYITGGCDYSGWGCLGDWGNISFTGNAEQAARYADVVEKGITQQLMSQLEGKQPYGLREEVKSHAKNAGQTH